MTASTKPAPELATTRALASFAANLKSQELPPATIDICKRLMLDGIGCLLTGAVGEPARAAATVARECGGNEQATIYADGLRSSAVQAALVNGMSLYSVGMHDFLQKAGAHPGACVIPTLLAVGEWRSTPGHELLAAMVAGYDVLDRVARSIMPGHRERGFHPTGTCGVFAAAAVAGRLLGLDASQMACAFGTAGSQAAGLSECFEDGSPTLIFHAGRAAKNGIEAALLTRAGLTGPATVLEGKRGFFRGYGDATDATSATAGLGKAYSIHQVSYRPFYGVTSTISACVAVADIVRRRSLEPAGVEAVKITCNPVVARDNAESDPRTLMAARLSVPFNVALVLARGEVLVRDLADRDLWDPAIRAALPLVTLTADAGCPRFGSSVEVRLKDGTVERLVQHSWRGDSIEDISWDEVVEKFHRVLDTVARPHREAIVQAVALLDDSDGAKLAATLGEAAASQRVTRA